MRHGRDGVGVETGGGRNGERGRRRFSCFSSSFYLKHVLHRFFPQCRKSSSSFFLVCRCLGCGPLLRLNPAVLEVLFSGSPLCLSPCRLNAAVLEVLFSGSPLRLSPCRLNPAVLEVLLPLPLTRRERTTHPTRGGATRVAARAQIPGRPRNNRFRADSRGGTGTTAPRIQIS